MGRSAAPWPFVHGTPLAELAVDDVMHPIEAFLRTNLITTKAVARHMTASRSGTIQTLSSGASRVVLPGTLGYGTTGAAIETMTQRLAVELGPNRVRVVCLRPHAITDAPSRGSFAGEVFGGRRGGLPGVRPRRRHHRNGDRPDQRQRRAHQRRGLVGVLG